MQLNIHSSIISQVLLQMKVVVHPLIMLYLLLDMEFKMVLNTILLEIHGGLIGVIMGTLRLLLLMDPEFVVSKSFQSILKLIELEIILKVSK
jgi:hypothetical protein